MIFIYIKLTLFDPIKHKNKNVRLILKMDNTSKSNCEIEVEIIFIYLLKPFVCIILHSKTVLKTKNNIT
jgi:hypothetical protein